LFGFGSGAAVVNRIKRSEDARVFCSISINAKMNDAADADKRNPVAAPNRNPNS